MLGFGGGIQEALSSTISEWRGLGLSCPFVTHSDIEKWEHGYTEAHCIEKAMAGKEI